MANITEQDIIDHLKEKIQFHQGEVKRIEGILAAFGTEPAAPRAKKIKAEATEEALAPLPEKKKTSKVKPAKTVTPKAAKALSVPAEYTDELPVNGKIAYALSQIGSGYNEDIANEMAKYEPKSDAKKIGKQISGILSTLKSKGLLVAEKSGRKDKFSLA